jgi:hypothetical protein
MARIYGACEICGHVRALPRGTFHKIAAKPYYRYWIFLMCPVRAGHAERWP